MKYFISVFLLLFAFSARAQITLEYTFPALAASQYLTLVQVDSAEWKYVTMNQKDSIVLFNLDHSLDRVIQVQPIGSHFFNLLLIAKRLFSNDGMYEYLISGIDSTGHNELQIFNENGDVLFFCDTCLPIYTFNYSRPNAAENISLFITSTSQGAKMLIRPEVTNRIEVYSLPGKLPTCSTMALSGVNPSIAYTNPTLPTSAYPNPSSSSVRIAYELPSGISSGDLILTTEDGREVKRYRVTSAFSDLLIESGDLPSGSYFYHLVTEKAESQAKRIVMTK